MGNATVGRKEETFKTVNPIIQGTSFHRLSIVLEPMCAIACSRYKSRNSHMNLTVAQLCIVEHNFS